MTHNSSLAQSQNAPLSNGWRVFLSIYARKRHYHDAVKRALTKAGWRITHDPLELKWAGRRVLVDLGAESESVLAAEREGHKIAIEVKSFVGQSQVTDLYLAFGQFGMYRTILRHTEPGRSLYLAIPERAYQILFDTEKFGEVLLQEENLQLVVFDPEREEITRWIP